MRLCDQDDTIGVTTTCDYVSGNVSVQHITYAPPVTSSTFTYNRVMQVAGGTWQLQQRSTEAWPNANWFGYTWLEKVIIG